MAVVPGYVLMVNSMNPTATVLEALKTQREVADESTVRTQGEKTHLPSGPPRCFVSVTAFTDIKNPTVNSC